MQSKVHLFSGNATKDLAERIATEFGQPLGNVVISKFSDGEFEPSFEETVRGSDVYIIQSTFAPTDNLFELLLMVDAAKRASAKSIVAVIPYFGYARQDRKDKPRVSIGAKLVANLLTAAGITRLMTMDLHSDQIQGFFDLPVDHIYASAIFIPFIKDLHAKLGDITMGAPDTGGARRAATYAKVLDTDLAICFKQRAKANVIAKMTLIGDVKDKNVILIDDIIDTGGTLTKSAEIIMNEGAKSVRAMCIHPVLSGNAYKKIEESVLTELIVTDSIPLRQECSKIKVLSTAKIFAEIIKNVHNHESIGNHFIIN
ncbi:MAG: ribose-phosphate pyrophosphokinase [Bacteroidetes bacterium GWE2_29_8]|nr:MAG: ribose-phosphate pyrophosphokinase [Bacteroidetes bacterium GWE2_29_8]